MRFISRDTAVRPIAREGCSTVVSCGETTSASSGAIEADHRDILRHPQSGLGDSPQRPGGEGVRNGKHRIGLLVLRQQLLHRPFTGRRAKILRVGHLLIRQTVHVQHAFIAALAQTGIAIAEVVINERDAAAAAIGQPGYRP